MKFLSKYKIRFLSMLVIEQFCQIYSWTKYFTKLKKKKKKHKNYLTMSKQSGMLGCEECGRKAAFLKLSWEVILLLSSKLLVQLPTLCDSTRDLVVRDLVIEHALCLCWRYLILAPASFSLVLWRLEKKYLVFHFPLMIHKLVSFKIVILKRQWIFILILKLY